MQIFFHICLGILIIALQTGASVCIPAIARPCDLMIPFAIYLALYRAPDEGLPVLVVSGVFMDSLSSGPFGVFLISYLSLFFVFKKITRWVHIHYAVLFFIVSFLGLLFENAICWISALFSGPLVFRPGKGLAILAVQAVWLIFTLPFLFMLFEKYFRINDRFVSGKSLFTIRD